MACCVASSRLAALGTLSKAPLSHPRRQHQGLACHRPHYPHSIVPSSNAQFLGNHRALRAPPGRTWSYDGVRYQRGGVVLAKGKTDEIVGSVVRTARQGVNAAAELVPDSVPRPVAQGGVAIVGVLVLLSITKAIFSTFISLVVFGALGYAAWIYFAKDQDTGGRGGGSGSSEDPLEEARRIMDKYK